MVLAPNGLPQQIPADERRNPKSDQGTEDHWRDQGNKQVGSKQVVGRGNQEPGDRNEDHHIGEKTYKNLTPGISTERQGQDMEEIKREHFRPSDQRRNRQ